MPAASRGGWFVTAVAAAVGDAIVTVWLTAQTASDYSTVGVDTIRAAVKAGELKAYAIGKGRREYRLTAEDVDEWMRSRAYEPPGIS